MAAFGTTKRNAFVVSFKELYVGYFATLTDKVPRICLSYIIIRYTFGKQW